MYGTPAAVISLTRIKPQDLGIETEDELIAQVTEWLEDATDLINADRDRDYDAEVAAELRPSVPRGIHSIANRVAANLAELAKLYRDDRTLTKGNNSDSSSLIESGVLTKSLREELALYPRGSEESPASNRGPRFYAMHMDDETAGWVEEAEA